MYARCLAKRLREVLGQGASVQTELSQLAEGTSRCAVRESPRASGGARGSTEIKVIFGGLLFLVEGSPVVEEVRKHTQEETPADRKERREALDKEADEAEQLWKQRADARDWDQVRHSLDVYEHAGSQVTEDPRRNPE